MKSAPMHTRRLSLRLIVLTAALAGCDSLRPGGTTTVSTGEPTAIAAAAPSVISVARRPAKHWLRVGPYVIHSETPLDAKAPIYKELADLPEQISRELELPASDGIVQVFLFENADAYDDYMRQKHPKLPKRRAYFFVEPRVGGGDDLLVFTWPSEHLAKDLRHELTHATLHGILKGVPLWLDEGLAGFFELPPDARGVNAGHLDALRRGPFQPDLPRLEKLTQVAQMETPEYREAWAWVHWMLRGGDPNAREVLLAYLKDLRLNSTPGPLQPRLCETLSNPNAALADHLAKAEK